MTTQQTIFLDNTMTAPSQHLKADAGKSTPSLLEKGFARSLQIVNDTLDYGALKYAANSWHQVPDGAERYDNAARRHRRQRDLGDTYDAESFVAHLGHEIVCNLMVMEFLIEGGKLERKEFNRNPPQSHKASTL